MDNKYIKNIGIDFGLTRITQKEKELFPVSNTERLDAYAEHIAINKISKDPFIIRFAYNKVYLIHLCYSNPLLLNDETKQYEHTKEGLEKILEDFIVLKIEHNNSEEKRKNRKKLFQWLIANDYI